ncbi:hypothetical protein BaRGS_00038139 [Batillaria attramentaria]|uniref:Uncharacterized protein n=1 Tax=Batillaria attramentaria TaxID=370345 RepID=A0ABD0J705_9CAEN
MIKFNLLVRSAVSFFYGELSTFVFKEFFKMLKPTRISQLGKVAELLGIIKTTAELQNLNDQKSYLPHSHKDDTDYNLFHSMARLGSSETMSKNRATKQIETAQAGLNTTLFQPHTLFDASKDVSQLDRRWGRQLGNTRSENCASDVRCERSSRARAVSQVCKFSCLRRSTRDESSERTSREYSAS